MRQRFPIPIVVLFISGLLVTGAISATEASSRLHLAGLALHQETGRDIYLGGIYFDRHVLKPDDFVSASAPRLMEYRVVARRTSMRSLLGGVLLQSEVATGRAPDSATENFANHILSIIKSSLYVGDSLEILLNAQEETIAYLNGQELARVNDRAVADYFLLGWVAERGPSSIFRASILSDQINPLLLATLEENTCSAERKAQIAAWLVPPDNSPDTIAPSTDSGPRESLAAASDTDANADADAKLQVELQSSLPEIAQTTLIADPGGSTVSVDAIQVASLTPTAELLDTATDNEIQSLGAQEYSQRLSDFHSRLIAMVYGQIRYPSRAVKRGLQGRLELDVTLHVDGNLMQVSVVQPSGYGLLDKAAVKAATKALSTGELTPIDPVAIEEFSTGENGNLVIPVPVNFMLTE